MRMLKWATIVLPILFLAFIDVLRHIIFPGRLHTISGFLGTYALMLVGVVAFSYGIFGFIGRLQQRVIGQNEQLAALGEIAKATVASPSLDDVLAASLRPILTNMKADAGLICLVDAQKFEHSVVCHSGFSLELVKQIQRAKLKDDPMGSEVVRTGQPVIIERVFEDPRVAELGRREGIRSAISAPLKSEGVVNGILAIATRKERRFSAVDQLFLERVGGQLGMAIRNALLYERSELQNRELGALLAVGKAVTHSFDLDELLSKALDTIIEVVPVDVAEVWLAEGDEEVVMRCQRGIHLEAFRERTRFRVGEGIPGLVAQSREPYLVHDLAGDGRMLRKEAVRAGFHCLCSLPLVYQQKLVGVLVVAALSAGAVRGQRELRLLDGIGEWLAIAIENARLYQQVQDLAILHERERIAREMHDGMAQLLGYINTQTIAVKKLLSDGRLAVALEELTRMEEIARDLYADVREGILGLRTAALRGQGLIPALRQYAERYTEMTGIKVEFDVNGFSERSQLPPPIEIQLMRIIQEALTNVRKHSKASEVNIAFERAGDELRVIIADNGQGFELAHLPSRGWPRFGLQTMRERAEAVGGSLTIHASIGTRVEVQIPLPHNGETRG